MQLPPSSSGIEMANWYWKMVRQFVSERFGVNLSRSPPLADLNYLHRLGFAFKRPKKRLLKADAEKREAFVAEYAALMDEAGQTGVKVFFADEAHFRADAELRGKWVLKGEPAPVSGYGAGFGGFHQPKLRGEGQLLLGGVFGDRRGGVDGAGGKQQLGRLGRLPEATEGEASQALEGDLGQCSRPSWGGDAGIPADARSGGCSW